jgi:hypothetical protein
VAELARGYPPGARGVRPQDGSRAGGPPNAESRQRNRPRGGTAPSRRVRAVYFSSRPSSSASLPTKQGVGGSSTSPPISESPAPRHRRPHVALPQRAVRSQVWSIGGSAWSTRCAPSAGISPRRAAVPAGVGGRDEWMSPPRRRPRTSLQRRFGTQTAARSFVAGLRVRLRSPLPSTSMT